MAGRKATGGIGLSKRSRARVVAAAKKPATCAEADIGTAAAVGARVEAKHALATVTGDETAVAVAAVIVDAAAGNGNGPRVPRRKESKSEVPIVESDAGTNAPTVDSFSFQLYS